MQRLLMAAVALTFGRPALAQGVQDGPARNLSGVRPAISRCVHGAAFVATTNQARESETLHLAPWQKTNAAITVAADSPSCPAFNGVAMDLTSNTSATNADAIYQTVAVPSSIGPFTASATIAAVSGTVTRNVGAHCIGGVSNAATCACARSDGRPCAATVDAHRCVATASVGVTPVRLSATVTCVVAVTSPAIALWPGERGVATGTACFSGAQFEFGRKMSPFIKTGGVTVTRPAGCYP
jgi:hypothetical protein